MSNAVAVSRQPIARRESTCHESTETGPVGHPWADPATGLPNRAMLDWYLAHLFALAPERPLKSVLLVIELNESKAIRYAFGDSVGDQFMRLAGQRFHREAKAGQFVSALNGEALAFVISKCAGREECMEIARRLLARIREPVSIAGRLHYASATIGIAFANVQTETPADLLNRAQAVLREARSEGSGGIKFADKHAAIRASSIPSRLNEARFDSAMAA